MSEITTNANRYNITTAVKMPFGLTVWHRRDGSADSGIPCGLSRQLCGAMREASSASEFTMKFKPSNYSELKNNREIRDPLSVFATKNWLWLHAGFLIAGTFICTGIAIGKVQPCDCGDVTFTPSAERIQITDSEAVKRKLLSSKEEPLAHQNLRATLKTADIALQRHVNGDLYQFHDPAGWEKYNSPIISMDLSGWQSFAETEEAKPNVAWDLCPFAKRAAVSNSAAGTSVRYELIRVGRFTAPPHVKDRRYDSSANGKLLFITVTVNAANKVSDVAQDPAGWFSRPVMSKQRQRKSLRAFDAEKPANDFGETQQKLDEERKSWRRQLADLNKAAVICDGNRQSRK